MADAASDMQADSEARLRQVERVIVAQLGHGDQHVDSETDEISVCACAVWRGLCKEHGYLNIY